MYGDIGHDGLSFPSYNAKTMYDIEAGIKDTFHYVGTYWNDYGKHDIKKETYQWTESVNAKIGLLYVNDYLFAYYDGVNETSRGNPGNNTNVKNSWIHFQKDGYILSPYDSEWFITKEGLSSNYFSINGYSAYYNGVSLNGVLTNPYLIRPTFYLNSDVSIKSGNGTKLDPYILDVQE